MNTVVVHGVKIIVVKIKLQYGKQIIYRLLEIKLFVVVFIILIIIDINMQSLILLNLPRMFGLLISGSKLQRIKLLKKELYIMDTQLVEIIIILMNSL